MNRNLKGEPRARGELRDIADRAPCNQAVNSFEDWLAAKGASSTFWREKVRAGFVTATTADVMPSRRDFRLAAAGEEGTR